MGSGKSTIGAALADKLDVPFVDSDAEIEVAATMSIAEIFARDGEAFFRDKEHQVIARLIAGAPAVLSTGGGAVITEALRVDLVAKTTMIWLDADIDALWARVRGKEDRPLLNTENPRAVLQDLLAARRAFYAEAHIRVDSGSGRPVGAIADEIIAQLPKEEG